MLQGAWRGGRRFQNLVVAITVSLAPLTAGCTQKPVHPRERRALTAAES